MGCQSSSAVSQSGGANGNSGFFDEYKLGMKLGRGCFAQVRIATKINATSSQSNGSVVKSTPEEVAVKIVDLRAKKHPEQCNLRYQKMAHREVGIWKMLESHPNCVQLYDVFSDASACYMVMEKCKTGLLDHFEHMNELTERTLGRILMQMLSSIQHLHNHRVVHRDIKPDNFLIGGEDGNTVKLVDFGLSAALTQGRLQGVYGTAPFMAPEMLEALPYNEKIDVWSVAVIAYALFFGTFPYKPKEPCSTSMKEAIREGGPPSFRSATVTGHRRSDSVVNFVKSTLVRDPNARPSAATALGLPYMSAISDNRHMVGIDLPSLRPALVGAKRVGVFEQRDPSRETAMDSYLNEYHFAKHGEKLPEVDPCDCHLDAHTEKCLHGMNHVWEHASDSTGCGSSAQNSFSLPSTRCSSKECTRIFESTGSESRTSISVQFGHTNTRSSSKESTGSRASTTFSL